MQKSYIWALPTRVFHAFCTIYCLCFWSAEDEWLNYHAVIGYGILILVVLEYFGVFWSKILFI